MQIGQRRAAPEPGCMEVLVDLNEHDTAEGFRPLLRVAPVILGVRDGRLLSLLYEAREGWGLPRCTPGDDETLDGAARRQAAPAIAPDCYLEQLCTWEDPGSEAASRVILVAYLGLTVPAEAPLREKWWPVNELPVLAETDARMIRYAHERLRRKLSYTNVAWSLLQPEFSLSEMQQVYEAVGGRPLDKRNFRKWVLSNDLVEPTPRERRDGAHRPARLYRFAGRDLRTLD
jgi:8-oxo-dGTP diphosphatase